MLNSNQKIIMQNFLKEIVNSEYYKAHETVEAIWFPVRFDKNNIKVKIFKGFINSAVSLRLVQLGKVKQSKKPFNTFLKYSKFIKKENRYLLNLRNIIINTYFKNIKGKK